ncbi:MAG: TRL-like family protein [Sulfurovaceae bacterium]|nr:TRL-like family protein [Sulfurovaceae bacterium]
MFKDSILLGSMVVFFVSGCAFRPTQAFVYTDTKAPYMATSSDSQANKRGISEECTNILGIVATGDCSIDSAKKNGGITTVSSVDWEGTSFLGIYSSGKTVVTGK